MTDLAKDFRAQLAEVAEIRTPDIVTMQHSSDGTRKWMLSADASQAFEMVFIPEKDRGTLCISSQVGCILDCSFCSTAQQGFNRNLTTAEIVGQVWLAKKELGFERPAATGSSPTSCSWAWASRSRTSATWSRRCGSSWTTIGFDLSRRRVTLSTSGLVPQIYKLAEETNVALAVSLHAPDDELRSELVPINRKHPIAELLDGLLALHRRAERSQRDLRVRHAGRSERLPGAGARAGALCLKGHPAKVNLIPFNPFPGTRYKRSPRVVIERFRDELIQRGVLATIRRTRGDDIDAACGQLAGRVIDRTTVRLGNKTFGVAVQQ